jgi:type II secretory pathway pseudopilin PulG
MRHAALHRGGFTLLEALISVAVLSIVGMTFAMSMRSMAALTRSGSARADVQRDGAAALEEILGELRASGFVSQGGFDYPYLFDDGVAQDGFEAHAHAVPPGAATANEYDFGPTREIVFLRPDDFDGDREPDVDAAGNLLWAPDEISYVLDQAADGTVALERRVNGGAPERIVTGVERVVFDDASTAPAEVPLNAVRVRIYFRVRDEEGHETKYFVEGTTRLRNG